MKQMMSKVVIFVAGRDPLEFKAGDVSYVRAHAQAALRAGFAPHLFCASRRTETLETDFGTLHRVASPFRPFRFPLLPGHGPLIIKAMERFLADSAGPHLIHGFGIWGYCGVALAHKLRRQGRPAVAIVSAYTTQVSENRAKLRGLNANHNWRQRFSHLVEHIWVKLVINRYERQTFLDATLVLANYESVHDLIAAQHRAAFNFRKMVYASESAFLRPPPETPPLPAALAALEPRAAPLIVTLSRHDARKGLDLFLRALAELQAQGVPFRACLVSGGLLLDAHRRLAERLGLAQTTTFTGFVPDPFPYLQHADIFVLPSHQEGSGSVSLLEALQSGLATIASNVDGIPEDLTDGDNALLVQPGDVRALAEALRQVLTDAALRARLKRRARETFVARFSAEAFTHALSEIYAELGFKAEPG